MKRKNGFTLVELLGVVVILVLIVAIAIPLFNNIFENQKEKAYQQKAELIAVAAEKWAEETNVSFNTTITVKRLIVSGYLQAETGDGEYGDIINPVDEESMLCYTIDIDVSDGTPQATVNDSDKQDCDLAEEDATDANLLIAAYSFDPTTNQIVGGLGNDHGTIDWTRNDVLLVVNSKKYENFTKVFWGNTGDLVTKEVSSSRSNVIELSNLHVGDVIDPNRYANVTTISTSLFLVQDYGVGLYVDNDTKTTSVEIRIDKETPTATVLYSGEWAAYEKWITIRGSDGSGSGLKGFYVTTSNTNPKAEGYEWVETDYEATAKVDNGTYYVFAEDIVGNVSDKPQAKVVVSNIDDEAPTIFDFDYDYKNNSTSSGIDSKINYDEYRKAVFKVVDHDSGLHDVKYCFTEDFSCTPDRLATIYEGRVSISFDDDKDYKKICVSATDNVGNVSHYCDSSLYLVDNSIPSEFEVSFDNNNTFSLNATDEHSGILKYVCSVTSSKDKTRTDIVGITDSYDASSSCKFENLYANEEYTYEIKAYNRSGIAKSFTGEFSTKDYSITIACSICTEANGYCATGVYLNYNNYEYVIYRDVTTGCKAFALNQKITSTSATDNITTAQEVVYQPYVKTFCCDQGYCNPAGIDNATHGLYANHKENNYTNMTARYNAVTPATRGNTLVRTTYTIDYIPSSKFGNTNVDSKAFIEDNIPDIIYQNTSYILPNTYYTNSTCYYELVEYSWEITYECDEWDPPTTQTEYGYVECSESQIKNDRNKSTEDRKCIYKYIDHEYQKTTNYYNKKLYYEIKQIKTPKCVHESRKWPNRTYVNLTTDATASNAKTAKLEGKNLIEGREYNITCEYNGTKISRTAKVYKDLSSINIAPIDGSKFLFYVSKAVRYNLSANTSNKYNKSSYYGLMTFDEYKAIRGYNYSNSLATMLSTYISGVAFIPSNYGAVSHHAYAEGRATISALFATGNYYYAVTPMDYGSTMYNLVLSFNKTAKLTGGNGKIGTPYIVSTN